MNADEIFGKLTEYIISTDEENVQVGDTCTILNSKCNEEYDNIRECFEPNLFYYYIVDLELIETDYTDYEEKESVDGGCYAYAKCLITEIYQKTY